MKYLVAKFRIECDEQLLQTARDLVADIAGEAGFESFEDTAEGIDGYVQETLFDRDALDSSLREFPLDDVRISYNINKVEDQDWNQEWERAGFEPIDIEGRVTVYDAKSATAADFATAPIAIGIEARQAFGTGTHETTRMIIASLLELPLPGKQVLDCGCGTGILSIAAAKLGATRCVGYDIDEWSVANSRHNAELNHVDNLEVYEGDAHVLDRISGTFDVVLANINRNILLADLPQFRKKMAEGATLILSGFYRQDVPLLCERAESLGLTLKGEKHDGEWTCLIYRS